MDHPHSRAAVGALVLIILSHCLGLVEAKCCNKKVVPGVGSKAGTYILASNSDPVPDFCLGGCVYTKENDPQPGTNYCFQEGAGEATCSGGGCGGGGGVEGWIEKYFEKQCSMQINSFLTVGVGKKYSYDPCVWSGSGVTNVSVELYNHPRCTGMPVQTEKTSRENGYYSSGANFLINVQNTKPWSVFVSKEGFKSECKEIGIMIPFSQNRPYIEIEEIQKDSILIPTVLLNFTFEINDDLLSDVFVQGNPLSCLNYTFSPFMPFANNIKAKPTNRKKHKKPKKPKRKSAMKMKQEHTKKPIYDYEMYWKNPVQKTYGSGSGSGSGGPPVYNSKCYPTCRYVSWNTESSTTPCNCKGVIGGGLKFSDITLPNQQTPAGMASMAGSIFWYNKTQGQTQTIPRFYTMFAEFNRRNDPSIRVCDSKLSITMSSETSPTTIIKTVPCFDRQIPNTTPMPVYPTFNPGGSESPMPTPMPTGSGPMPVYPTSNPGGSEFPMPTPMSTGSGPMPVYPTSNPGGSDFPMPTPMSSGSGFRVARAAGLGPIPTPVPSIIPALVPSLGSGPWPSSYPKWMKTPDYGEEFYEVDGVLIYGNGDRFWIFGCMALDNLEYFIQFEVDFFTAKDPRETPEFCGCLVSSFVTLSPFAPPEFPTGAVASKGQIKACFEKGLVGGPSPRSGRAKPKMAKKKKLNTKKQWKKKNKDLRGRIKKLKNKIEKQKTFPNGRQKRNVFDREIQEDKEDDDFTDSDENLLDENEMISDEDEILFEEDYDFDLSSGW